MTILLGCIADDYTGATDLANTLVRPGLRTVQFFGPPEPGNTVPKTDAVVIALKSRTNPAGEAIELSLAGLDWLQGAGAAQYFFQILLHIRFDGKKQYRPRRRCLDGRIGHGFYHCLPGLP